MRMRRWVSMTLPGLSVLLVGSSLGILLALHYRDQACRESDPAASSLLFCAQRVIDLGQMYRPVSQKVPLRYKIENRSGRHLDLRVIKRSCACAEATLIQEDVPAGETTELQVVWDVPNAVGVSDMRVYVADETVENALIALDGTVEIRDVVRIQPSELDLGAAYPGTLVKGVLSIYASPGELLTSALEVPSTCNNSGVQAEAIKRSGAKMTVAVTATGDGSGTEVGTDLVIRTGEAVQPTVVVPVRVKHVPVYSGDPALLTYDLASDANRSRSFTVRSNIPGRSVNISRIGFDEPSCFSATLDVAAGESQSVSAELLRVPTAPVGTMRLYLQSEPQTITVNYVCLGFEGSGAASKRSGT
jgi:hypothetical protein